MDIFASSSACRPEENFHLFSSEVLFFLQCGSSEHDNILKQKNFWNIWEPLLSERPVSHDLWIDSVAWLTLKIHIKLYPNKKNPQETYL